MDDTKSKKKRKNKKKNAAAKDDSKPPASPVENGQQPMNIQPEDDSEASEHEQEHAETIPQPTSHETTTEANEPVGSLTNGTKTLEISDNTSDATSRFDALVRDRDALLEEVTRLRESLEEVTRKYDDQSTELETVQGERETAEENYQNLLRKVNTIRSQLGERLKADAEDLAQARTRIEELEEQRTELQENYTTKANEVDDLSSKNNAMVKELDELRGRSTLSQQNWVKERDELREQETYWREEFEQAKQAMHDWEVLAMEERSIRRDLSDRVADLEEQLASIQREYERVVGDRDTQSGTVDGLQKAMAEIQNARKRELREVVESSQTEVNELRKQWEEVKAELKIAKEELEYSQKELERALPFEKEVKEKNLLIGKLRHEAVILNDHLTKALRFLKKGKPEDNVDRQIVTNHFLHFLALDRSDSKKFQILQLISALLNWTDEQKEQAGLQRAGAPAQSSLMGSLRLPGTPMMHKTPSSPALSRLEDDYMNAGSSISSPSGKESLAELWQNFLEQEAATSSTKSRTASTSTAAGMMSPSVPK